MKKIGYSLLLVLFYSFSGFCQIPVDNPFYTRYHIKGHWTDTLRWKNVTDASRVDSLVDSKGHVDPHRLEKTMNIISAAGGGVLYFKAGDYYFDYNITVPGTVVLRGANPPVRDAKKAGYRPPTKFNFPKYVPTFTGSGTPDSTAFKTIALYAGNSVGIVNIDVNRASIFVPFFASPNVIVFGLRLNNAQDVRTPFLAKSKNHAWERYPTGDNANLVVSYSNAVVANCRVNDAITDDFDMPDFLTNDGYVLPVVKFEYAFQIGMRINPHTDTSAIELRDNYVKAYEAADIAGHFGGKKHVSDNEFIPVACQDYVTNEFYYRKRQDKVREIFGDELLFTQGPDTLRYLLLKPENYDSTKTYPLVVFLHGIGQHGSNNPLIHFTGAFVEDSVRKRYPYFVAVPHIRDRDRFDTTLSTPPTKVMRMSIDLAVDLKRRYSIDTNRTYIAGISSGGGAVIEAIARYPDVFKTAIIMSALRRLTQEQVRAIKNIHFIISVGTQDENVPIQAQRTAIAALKQQGSKVDYFEYEGVGHWSWLNLGVDQRFLDILFPRATIN